MNTDQIPIYHITDVENLPGILQRGGLDSDAIMATKNPALIAYGHIKKRRLEEIRVPCCGGRFVGEFVPFYFCPRSPMLFTVNKGNTGRPPGCQRTILHLVSAVSVGIDSAGEWAVSDGNAGAFHTCFDNEISTLEALDWDAIGAVNWQGRQHEKAAEFLVADFFSWTGFHEIACHNSDIANHVARLLQTQKHQPSVTVRKEWYY